MIIQNDSINVTKLLPATITDEDLENIYEHVIKALESYLYTSQVTIYFDTRLNKIVFNPNENTIFELLIFDKNNNKKLNKILSDFDIKDKDITISEINRIYKSGRNKFIKEINQKKLSDSFTVEDFKHSFNHTYYLINQFSTQNLISLVLLNIESSMRSTMSNSIFVDNAANILLKRDVHLTKNRILDKVCLLYFESTPLLKLLEKSGYFNEFYNRTDSIILSPDKDLIEYLPYNENLESFLLKDKSNSNILLLLKMGLSKEKLINNNITNVNINLYNINKKDDISYLKNIDTFTIDYFVSQSVDSDFSYLQESFIKIYDQINKFNNKVVFLNQKENDSDKLKKLLLHYFMNSNDVNFEDTINVFNKIQNNVVVLRKEDKNE